MCLAFLQLCTGQNKDTFKNPILENAADPYAYLHEDGNYYFMATRGNRLDLWRTDDLTQLESVTPKTIWSPPETGANSCCVWAPEIHYIDGKWYVYYTGSDKADEGDDSRYVFVLENSNADPMEGEWIDRGKVNTQYSGIDGSVFQYKGKLYFLYSPYVNDHSDVAIATMSDPWTLNDDESILAAPKYDWEKTDERSILEGPMFLEGPKNEVFIVYSAGACWDDNYSLGMLAAKKDSDFLKASSWQRFPEAVFEMSDENQVYGPGHHGFTTSKDGKENWLLFHAKDKPELGCAQRSARLQGFTWTKDGRPDFGIPWSLAKTYVNPVLDINFPDPTVIKAADGFYYAYATNSAKKNIQVRKSQNLVDWEDAGDALPDKPTWADKDFWAPHVSYDNELKTYFLYYSGESNDKSTGKCLGVASSKSPLGPFGDMGKPLLCGDGFVNIDPMAFDDPQSGKKLLFWGSAHEAIKVRELADDRMSFKTGTHPVEVVRPITDGDPNNYRNLIEGAWVTVENGYYYLYFSGDNCCGEKAHYAVMVARSKNAMGPFETLSEVTESDSSVILERNGRWIAPGHNSVITDDAGQEWMAYHAIDSLDREKGRVMLIDKIIYRDDWPQVRGGVPSTEHQKHPTTEK